MLKRSEIEWRDDSETGCFGVFVGMLALVITGAAGAFLALPKVVETLWF